MFSKHLYLDVRQARVMHTTAGAVRTTGQEAAEVPPREAGT